MSKLQLFFNLQKIHILIQKFGFFESLKFYCISSYIIHMQWSSKGLQRRGSNFSKSEQEREGNIEVVRKGQASKKWVVKAQYVFLLHVWILTTFCQFLKGQINRKIIG